MRRLPAVTSQRGSLMQGLFPMLLAKLVIARVSLCILASMCAGGVTAAYYPVVPPPRLAAQGRNLERQVMAAFLFKFGQFVVWPSGMFDDGDRPLVIGVIGADDIADDLRQITPGRRIRGHPVTVRRIEAGESVTAQILFIDSSRRRQVRPLLDILRGHPVLTVTANQNRDNMGIINFVVINNRLRFDIDLDAAKLAGLSISAQLLQVAHHVYEASQ
jgi:hypothetical protein